MARANPGHPRLLVLDDPSNDSMVSFCSQTFFSRWLRRFKTNTHLVDVLTMMVDPTSDMVDLPLVILECLLLLDDVDPEIRFQLIALKEQSV